MRCEKPRGRLSEYLDGALPSREAAELERHLTECESCRRELEALRHTVRALRELPREAAPPGFGERVMERVRADSPAPTYAGAGGISLWPRALSVAAMLLAVVGLTFLLERDGFFGAGERASRRTVMLAKGEGPVDRVSGAARRRGPLEEGLREVADTNGLGRKQDDKDAREGRALDATVWRQRDDVRRFAEAREAAEAVDMEGEGAFKAVPALPALTEAEEIRPAVSRERWEEGAPGRRPEAGVRALRRVVAEEPSSAARLPVRRAGRLPLERQKRAVFRQVALADAQQPEETEGPDQILIVEADKPLELAEKTVEIANANDIGDVTLSLPSADDGPDAGVIEVSLRVPAARYEEFLRQVSGVSLPHEQRLCNSVAAGDNLYFQDVSRRYERSQAAAVLNLYGGRPERREEMRAPARAGIALEGREEAFFAEVQDEAKELRLSLAFLSPGEQVKAEVSADFLPPGREVNLLIRLVRRAVPVAESAGLPAEAKAGELQETPEE